MLLDVRFDRVAVAEFKGCDVRGGVEEERLAVASVLEVWRWLC